jgi:hypothetical protein
MVAALAIVVGGSLGPAGFAVADQPVVPNCVGTTSSGNAQALPPGGLGERRAYYARLDVEGTAPGFGDSIHLLQAGVVPDEIANNTCND